MKEETKQKLKLAGWSIVDTVGDIAVIAAGVLVADVVRQKTMKNEEN